MNDTLSYVEKLERPENDQIEPYPFTDSCPVCGGEVVVEGAFALCGNDTCEGKLVGRIEKYLVTLDIKGIKASTIEKLTEAGLVRDIPDLYTMDYSKIASIDGLGKSTANQIKKAIHGYKPYDYEILAGIGIRDFGKTSAKALCMNKSFYEIMTEYEDEKFYSEVTSMEGFSYITATKLINGLGNNHNTLVELYELIEFKEIKEELASNSDSETYTFCITGTLTTWKRNDLKKILESRGHKVAGGVSKNTDYLVNNDIESTSSKNVTARDLGIPIISEETLKEMLGL